MKTLSLIAALVVVSLHAFGAKVKGTIISNGTSRDVTFDMRVSIFGGEPNFVRIQTKVKYYDENGKKQTLRPEDADEFRFDYDGVPVRMISCVNTLGGSLFSKSAKIFLKLEIDGPLRLYRYYYTQNNGGYYGPGGYMGGGGIGIGIGPGGGMYSPGGSYTAENLIFQKGNGPLKQPRSMGWKKDMIEYFSDCPALQNIIEGKGFKRKDVEEIVLYYNQRCGK